MIPSLSERDSITQKITLLPSLAQSCILLAHTTQFESLCVRSLESTEKMEHTCTTTPTVPDLDALPNEILGLIIRHLEWGDRVRIERVNRRLRQLAFTHSWSDVTHVSNFELDDAVFVHVLNRCGKFVNSMLLDSAEDNGPTGVIEILKRCPNMTNVGFRDMPIDIQLVDYLRVGHGNKLK